MDSAKLSNWDRPWTAEELKENADNWSLAGDVALLNTLKAFSEKLLNQTGEISDKIDTLLNSVDEAGLKLDLAQNEFQNLKNTQFIESRVYDDDETLDSNDEKKSTEVLVPKDEKEQIVITSIKNGMKILEEYYDKLEVSVSDSEEDTESSKICDYVLKPKDMYAHRPLPPIIGSEEWYKKWHLDIPSSDSESDKVSDIYSDSDSEDNLPKDLIKGSETSSELDFSSHVNENRPVANSTFNTSGQRVDLEASSVENDDQFLQDANASLSNKSFAEQLAAKLGNIISEQEIIPQEVNRRPIQPTKIENIGGNLLSDEPPPLDNFDDSVLPEHIHAGYFSGGQGLFDDNDEDELFWGQPKKLHTNKEAKPDDMSKVSQGLFDEDSSSEEEMFGTAKKVPANNKYLQSIKPVVELYDEEPPEIQRKSSDSTEGPKKKPVGGVPIFGSSDIFNKNTSKLLKEMPKDHAGKAPIEANPIAENTVANPKRRNLFDEDEVDDLFDTKNTLLSGEPKRNRKNLFDDIDNVEENDVKVFPSQSNMSQSTSDNFLDNSDQKLFETSANKVDKSSNKPKKVSLFDDDDDLYNDDDFFSNIGHTKLNPKLFGDIENKFDDLFNIKDDPKTIASPRKKDSKSEVRSNTEKSKSNTEDLETDKPTNIIGVKKQIEDHLVEEKVEVPKTENIFSNPNDKKSGKKILSLFDDSDSEEIVQSKIKLEPDTLESNKKIVDINVNKASEIKEDTQNETNNENVRILEEDKSKIISADPVLANKNIVDQKSNISKKKIQSLFGESDSDDDNHKKSNNFMFESDEGKNVGTDENKSLQSNVIEEKASATPSEGEVLKQAKVEKEKPTSKVEEPASASVESKEKTKNIVGLFDSIPPPDDYDEWDQKSDTPSDAEEYLPYDVEEPLNRSSVFDDEPPAFEPNVSSGIVKDYSAIRVDTDDSDFNPTASSSRRLSSDLFSDQQSKDSFFITKSKTESLNPSNLHVVPEVSPADFTDITPSGNIKDFQSDTASSVIKNSQTSKLEGKGEETSNVVGRIASIKQSLQNESSQKNPTEPKSSPGKLKLNLDINVKALRPGLAVPKFKTLPKSQSLELPNDDTDAFLSDQDNSISSNKETYSRLSEHVDILKEGEEKIEVLQSITKNRAKIPVKRRRPSRKGRLEAVRRSAAELQFYIEDNDNITEHDTKVNNNNAANEDLSYKINTSGVIESKAKDNLNISTAKSTLLKENSKTEILSTEYLHKSEDKAGTEKSQEQKEPLSLETKNSTTIKVDQNLNKSDDRNIETLSNPKVVNEPLMEKQTKDVKFLFDDYDDASDDEMFFSSNIKKNEDLNESVDRSNKKAQTENKNIDEKTTKLFSESIEGIFTEVSKQVPKSSVGRLFGSDDDSDGELFKKSSKSTGQKKDSSKSFEPATQERRKKPLFNDSSSDEDLFSSAGNNEKMKSRQKVPATETHKAYGFKKSKNEEATDDPLSKLL